MLECRRRLCDLGGGAEMIRALVILVLLGLIVPALSHSFYPKECCSDTDCAPLDASRVQVTPSGYVIDGTETVPFSKALFSPDEHYHACWPRVCLAWTCSRGSKLGCFFAPRQAM